MSDPSQAPRRRRRPQQAPPPAQGSVARGAVLVVIALIIGIVLLRDSSSTPEQQVIGSVSTEDGGGETDEGGDDGDDATSTTSTTAPPLLRSEVKVLVANGSPTNGAAGRQTDELEALGYVTGTPTNAERVTATVIYFATGFQAEAEVLATDIGATVVEPMPTVAPVDDLQNAMLLVVLGPDLASGG